eukprot:Nk52_evm3s2152 gene=Nk52_evmTU3s2152
MSASISYAWLFLAFLSLLRAVSAFPGGNGYLDAFCEASGSDGNHCYPTNCCAKYVTCTYDPNTGDYVSAADQRDVAPGTLCMNGEMVLPSVCKGIACGTIPTTTSTTTSSTASPISTSSSTTAFTSTTSTTTTASLSSTATASPTATSPTTTAAPTTTASPTPFSCGITYEGSMEHPSPGVDFHWEGWATTTQFGCGDGNWGNPPNDVAIKLLNDPNVPRLGAAIPWRFYCGEYHSKQAQTEAVVGSINGSGVKACYLAQPISAYPGQISKTNDGAPLFCKGDAECVDINSPDIAAKDGSGKAFPAYLIVPFEGCGGDCKEGTPAHPDCFNTCAGASFVNAIECAFDKTSNVPQCGAMNALYANGSWAWNSQVERDFMEFSNTLAISSVTDYGKEMSGAGGGHVNWCSGQNMHFDVGLDRGFWQWINENGMGDVATTNSQSNIVMRYSRVACDYYGFFEYH